MRSLIVLSIGSGFLAACDNERATRPEPMQEIPAPPAGFLRFVDIDAGAYSACGLTADSLTYCWGLGHMFNDGMTNQPILIPVPKFGSIAVGLHHEYYLRDLLCGTTASGDVVCRGASANGRVTVPGSSGYSSVTVGKAVCALAPDRSGRCWKYTQLASILGSLAGDELPLGTPVTVEGGRAYATIKAGPSNACAITDSGESWCWGYNHALQIGPESAGFLVRTPIRRSTAHTFASISPGMFHSCALTGAGKAYCWGMSTRGQLGQANPPVTDCPGVSNIHTGDLLPCVPTPVEVAGEFTFTAAAVGEAHSCALDAAGAAYCWGLGTWGQTGNGRRDISNWSAMPQRVVGQLRFRRIVAGAQFTCAIATDDATYCWGRNDLGQLGIEVDAGFVGMVPHPVAMPRTDARQVVPQA